ncbi:hypothetical protein JWG39_11465 [Desulforhopalus vacuolatus]|uniref:hypothetical protein n=1 Tax=Desulforhopalus vacuolatus TaxID=40414 RepID=UPI0019656BDE|nr:hypothetical protein [Desulforhopalus vacuolatus]MBM9520431.1 hypothetical protein [Desulforhopalus vacuolatus]
MKMSVFTVVVLAFLFSGCAGQMMTLPPAPGMTVKAESRINLEESTGQGESTQKGLFAGDDFSLAWELSCNGDDFTLKGKVALLPSLYNTFPNVASFRLLVSFADKEGTVLSSEDITPFYIYLQSVDKPFEVKKSGNIPPGTKAFAFSAKGVFQSERRDNNGSCELFTYPFEKGTQK